MNNFYVYLLVMALVTYLIRLIPLLLFNKKITNRYVLSFLYYIPYSILTVMTIPAIFYSTGHILSTVVGFVAALLAAYKGKSLLVVTILTCLSVFIIELFL